MIRRLTLAALIFVLGGVVHAAPAVMRVAVMEFTSASSDKSLDQLGKGLQSMVTTDLANVGSLTVVERERLKDIQGELKLSGGKAFDKATAAQIGKLSGASHLFVGSYTVVGDSMRLDGRLIAVGTGEVLAAEQIAGEKALFFELEQKLVQKIIGLLGVKLQPKERAALARPHTADFQAFQKFAEGIQAFDDGRLDDAMKDLNEATSIDKDFKLASLTLDEYEKLAAQVRAKASAAGHVEDEMKNLEKNKAIAAEVAVIRQLWPVVDTKGGGEAAKLKRIAAACALVSSYRSQLGFRSRGPVNSEDLAAAGFDDFTLERTADALFARAWSEAPDVFPRVPPLCLGFGGLSSGSDKSIDFLLDWLIKRAAELAAKHDALLSYMANNASIDPAVDALNLDPVGRVKLWEKLYQLAQKLPDLGDDDRARFETYLAEYKRAAGDFDGATQMLAAASRHTKDSYKLKQYAQDIDKNKKLKLTFGPGAPPLVRELFLLRPGDYDNDRIATDPAQQKRLLSSVNTGRELSDREKVLFGDYPTWRAIAPSFQVATRTGPRSSMLRADELRYEGRLEGRNGNDKPPISPVVYITSQRGRRVTVKATIDQSLPPADWTSYVKQPVGGGEVGVTFAMRGIYPAGSLHPGQPGVTIAWGVLVGDDKVRLVRIQRDGDHKLLVQEMASAGVNAARGGKRPLEVKVEAQNVAVTVDGKRVNLPWKPEGDTDGFVGFMMNGVGYAAIAQPAITVEAGK